MIGHDGKKTTKLKTTKTTKATKATNKKNVSTASSSSVRAAAAGASSSSSDTKRIKTAEAIAEKKKKMIAQELIRKMIVSGQKVTTATKQQQRMMKKKQKKQKMKRRQQIPSATLTNCLQTWCCKSKRQFVKNVILLSVIGYCYYDSQQLTSSSSLLLHLYQTNVEEKGILTMPPVSASAAAAAAHASASRILSSPTNKYGSPPTFLLYGTAWKGDETARLVEQAIYAGFRFIDTACQPKHYNEAGVGRGWTMAAKALQLNRSDVYIQTKYTPVRGQDPNNIPYNPKNPLEQQVQTSLDVSLRNLQTTYLDALVLHSPLPTMEDTMKVWRTMESFVDQGKVHRLGISNCYDVQMFQTLYQQTRIKPSIVQNRFYAQSNFDTDLRAFIQSVNNNNHNKNNQQQQQQRQQQEEATKGETNNNMTTTNSSNNNNNNNNNNHNNNDPFIWYQSFWTLTANKKALALPEIKVLAESKQLTPETLMYAFMMSLGYATPLSGTTDRWHMKQDVDVMERLHQHGPQYFFPERDDLLYMAKLLGIPQL